MSMTPEQREKAERAIFHKKIQDILKRHALERRNECIQNVEFFGLPFRVLYSLNQSESQMPLSRFYPFRACSAETEARVNEALKEARERQGELSDEEIQEIRERLEAIDYTPEADRERLFACFLEGWDFSTFKSWDWTGNKIPAEEADRLRAYYTERQKQYQDHPERFSPPALKVDDDMSRYDRHTKYMLRMLDDIREQEDIDYWTEQEGEFFRNESKFIGKQKGE
ncbi:hypothetical protein [[Ruminococcus] torques]|uniref:hypothetical protein n=1 Tax=[Ruminococcus] torques TaxID=33039 RepID=UPI003AEFC715